MGGAAVKRSSTGRISAGTQSISLARETKGGDWVSVVALLVGQLLSI